MNNIAILVYDYSLLGGVQKVTRNLAELMHDKGWPIKCVISLHDSKEIQFDYPVKVEVAEEKKPLESQILDILNRYEIGNVIVQVENLKFLYPIINSIRQNGCQVYPVLHNSPYYWIRKYYDWYKYVQSPRRIVQYLKMALYWKPLHLKLFRRIVSSCGMICVSQQAHQELCDILGLPTDTEKIKYIYNPVGISGYDLPDGEKKNNILYAGRLSIEKRPMLMLRLWKDVSDKYPDWNFYILGDGPDRRAMERYIVSNHLQRVHLQGSVTNVADFLNESKISLLLSKYEGLPTSILEAGVSLNALVVAQNDGGTSDIVKNGENGYIINVSDYYSLKNHLITLMEVNGAKALQMGKKNAAILEKFDDKYILAAWQDTLQ